MRRSRSILKLFSSDGRDERFLSFLEQTEKFTAKLLSLAMVGVLLVATYDLFIFLIQKIFTAPFGFGNTTLIEIFGLFLNVLIALEILENITAYLRKNVIQVQLVITTSLIAVARKIIILDFDKTDGTDLIGLAIAVFALSISYWIIKSTSVKSHRQE